MFIGRKRGFQRENSDDLFLSHDSPGPSSQVNVSSQQHSRNSTLRELRSMTQNMEMEKDMQLISNVIRYLFMADRNKQPIQKAQIIKNVLDGNSKIFRLIIERVNKQLSGVYICLFYYHYNVLYNCVICFVQTVLKIELYFVVFERYLDTC